MITLWFKRRRYLRFTRNVAEAIRQRLIRVLALFTILFVLHVIAMMATEGLSLNDALWVTITTATTVGYGDVYATTPVGRLATVVCMYVFGIFLLAQAASDVFDYRALSRERRRRGEYHWKDMKDHLLVINVPAQDTDTYLLRLVDQVRQTPSMADIPVQLLTTHYSEGLLTALIDVGVTHYNGVAENSENMATVNVTSARCVIIIADETTDARCDAHTFDILSRIQKMIKDVNVRGPVIVAEVVDDVNRKRILAVGATTVVRPVRAYPELIVRALVAPGTEQVLENLFTHASDRLARFDAPFQDLKWQDVVVGFVKSNAGVPLGFVRNGVVDTNPSPSALCSGDGIIILVDESQEVSLAKVEECLVHAAYTLD